MNHQERMELLGALSRAGVSHYKSLDLEIKFQSGQSREVLSPADAPTPGVPIPPDYKPTTENEGTAKKLSDLIDTLKMDDASLLDKIFPAGAGF